MHKTKSSLHTVAVMMMPVSIEHLGREMNDLEKIALQILKMQQNIQTHAIINLSVS